jgi:hypothetical protein
LTPATTEPKTVKEEEAIFLHCGDYENPVLLLGAMDWDDPDGFFPVPRV